MVWKTELINNVEDQALDDPAKALKDRRCFQGERIQHFRADGLPNTEQPSTFSQDFSHFQTEGRLTLLDITLQIAYSQRQRSRQIQSELDDTRKELDLQQTQVAHYAKLVTSMMQQRTSKTSIRDPHQQSESSRLTCPVCRITDINVVTDCGHVFCKDCITHWLTIGDSCPICRKPLCGAHHLHI